MLVGVLCQQRADIVFSSIQYVMFRCETAGNGFLTNDLHQNNSSDVSVDTFYKILVLSRLLTFSAPRYNDLIITRPP